MAAAQRSKKLFEAFEQRFSSVMLATPSLDASSSSTSAGASTTPGFAVGGAASAGSKGKPPGVSTEKEQGVDKLQSNSEVLSSPSSNFRFSRFATVPASAPSSAPFPTFRKSSRSSSSSFPSTTKFPAVARATKSVLRAAAKFTKPRSSFSAHQPKRSTQTLSKNKTYVAPAASASIGAGAATAGTGKPATTTGVAAGAGTGAAGTNSGSVVPKIRSSSSAAANNGQSGTMKKDSASKADTVSAGK